MAAAVAAIGAVSHAAPFGRELGLPPALENGRVTRLVHIDADATATLMEMDGPGCVTHLWMTMGENDPRRVVLRMYWDGEPDPSVEAPLADFFGVGHGERAFTDASDMPLRTPCLVVAPDNGYNAYLPMPFREHARITVTNDQDAPLKAGGGLYFQADYVRYDALAESVPYLHAQWRREAPALRRARPYTIVQALGDGFLAGVTIHVRADDTSDAWFHGGGDTIFLDGLAAPNLIKGIGGEDFVGAAWGAKPFASRYAGCTVSRDRRVSLYRFFLEAPPRFTDAAWFALGAMANEITSVGYWYQREPHVRFAALPPPELRAPASTIAPGAFDVELLPDRQLDVAVVGPFLGGVTSRAPIDSLPAQDLSALLRTNYPKLYKTADRLFEAGLVRWERARTTLFWLDFEALYKPKMEEAFGVETLPDTLAYACIRAHCDDAESCTLSVGHDDAVRVFTNGVRIADLSPQPRFTLDEVELELAPGANDILLKIANAWNTDFAAFAVSLGLRDSEGHSPPQRFRLDNFAALPRAPDYAQ
ncbi:MAG: DUF2961 domain-containing protein [Candidatus Hydrogenedentes bacterium]|nr:DUF2961 domain-containing protein [Candidatus Hydrogenedentota bacterium]